MSSGFDDRVEARLIGLRMATDTPNGLDAIVVGSSNLSLSNENFPSEETDNRNSVTPTFSSQSSNSSSNNNNAPVTARR